MTDAQIERIYDAMIAVWEVLPNPEQEPRRFEYYVKLFKYCHNDEWEKALNGTV